MIQDFSGWDIASSQPSKPSQPLEISQPSKPSQPFYSQFIEDCERPATIPDVVRKKWDWGNGGIF